MPFGRVSWRGCSLPCWQFASSTSAPPEQSFVTLAKMAELFFLAVSGTQLALVLLAAPAATAGAICLDRARGTLSHMLMTDLSNGEIVLGKLGARLVPVLSMLLCALPVMELLALLGGVDPAALVGSFAVSLGVAVLGCSLAMFFSLWVGKTHEAVMATYAVWSLWLLARPVSDLVVWIGWAWGKPPRTADPFFLALAPTGGRTAWRRATTGGSLEQPCRFRRSWPELRCCGCARSALRDRWRSRRVAGGSIECMKSGDRFTEGFPGFRRHSMATRFYGGNGIAPGLRAGRCSWWRFSGACRCCAASSSC